MGCCISKCRDQKHNFPESNDEFNHHLDLQDKLVISQPPPTPSNKLLTSNYPPLSPTSSISSFTCTTNSNTLSSASSISTSSSASSSAKVVDRSFSNEFLWSCYKDNPHIINNSTKTLKIINPPSSPMNKKMKQPSPSPSPSPQKKKKRVRSNSPTNLTRQKSFRKEPPAVLLRQQQPINSAAASSNIAQQSSRIRLVGGGVGVGSPSPSRRFNASARDNYSTTAASRRTMIVNSSPKVSSSSSSSSKDHYSGSGRKEYCVKAASPNNMRSLSLRQQLHSAGGLNLKRHKETVVKDVVLSSSRHEDNHMMMDYSTMLEEDIQNPHISLDCFIFL